MSQDRDFAEAAKSVCDLLGSSISKVSTEAHRTIAREHPLFFPDGIQFIQIDVTVPPFQFKLTISGDKSPPKLDIDGERAVVVVDGDVEDSVPEDPSDLGLLMAHVALPPVDTQLSLPKPGLYGYRDAVRRFGTANAIKAMIEIGTAWHGKHAKSPIGVGEISKMGGGPISGHKSYQKGVDFDIRPQRKDGAESPVTIQDAQYSRALTQDLVNVIRANKVLPVANIFFNDPKISGVQHWPKHDDHLHVRFQLA